MDSSEISWLAEMGLDNSIFTDQCDFLDSLSSKNGGLDNSIFMDQCDFLDSIDEDMAVVLGQEFDNSSSSSTLINIPSTNSINSLCHEPPRQQIPSPSEPPSKLQKPNNYPNFSTIQQTLQPNSSTPVILNFGNTAKNAQQVSHQGNSRPLNPEEEAAVTEVLRSQVTFPEPDVDQSKRPQAAVVAKKPSRVRPPSQTYDHIIAERKRREQLSQRFVALSTIVPGLKKMDKTSVLGDAIKYLKHLQERVKTLEEQATKQTMESVVLVKRSQIMVEDEGSSDEKSGCSDEQPLPEIEARVCKNHILLRVHCEKQKGVLVNVLSNVEAINLSVINTNVTPFGSLALDITIVAEMEKDFNLTVKDVVKRLRAAL